MPAASGLRRRSPAKPAAGPALPHGADYDAGKSGLSPFRVRASASETRFPPCLSMRLRLHGQTGGQCCTSDWNWGVKMSTRSMERIHHSSNTSCRSSLNTSGVLRRAGTKYSNANCDRLLPRFDNLVIFRISSNRPLDTSLMFSGPA